MRLFVAIDIPQSLKHDVETKVVEPLRTRLAGARVTWVRPEGRHITLKFLGNVAPDRTAEVAKAVERASLGHEGYSATFNELGGFPHLGRPRVMWLGLGEGAQSTINIAADLDAELEPVGFAREGRPFHPHLTLARFRYPSTRKLPFEVEVPTQAFGVADITLFESQLHPKGARYSVLERFPLGVA